MSDVKYYSPAIEEFYEVLVPSPGWRRIPVMAEKDDGGWVSVADYMTLQASVAELEARIAEAEKQEPAYWYLPSLEDDGEDALLMPLRDGTSPAVGAIPLYTRPLPAPVAAVPDGLIDTLRKFNAWRKGEIHEWNVGTHSGPDPREITQALDDACHVLAAFVESHQLPTNPAESQIGQDVVHNAQAVPDDVVRDAERLPFDDVVDITTHYRHDGNGIVVPLVMVAFNEGHHEANATWKSRDQFAAALNAMLAAKAKGGAA